VAALGIRHDEQFRNPLADYSKACSKSAESLQNPPESYGYWTINLEHLVQPHYPRTQTWCKTEVGCTGAYLQWNMAPKQEDIFAFATTRGESVYGSAAFHGGVLLSFPQK